MYKKTHTIVSKARKGELSKGSNYRASYYSPKQVELGTGFSGEWITCEKKDIVQDTDGVKADKYD